MNGCKALLIIPTYNERENVRRLCEELIALELPLDILFIDDNSPDGTGEIIDQLCREHQSLKNSKLMALHRPGKQGIGSAHQAGISYAYENGYDILLSMDADFTHRPVFVAQLFNERDSADVIVASRHLSANSLPGWNLFRKTLTTLGHQLTRFLLGMSYDATGALRLYRIDRIPHEAFKIVGSSGYSFFFESLFVLFKNGFSIKEVPITLPARTYGSSKMVVKEIINSLKLLISTAILSKISPDRFRLGHNLQPHEIDQSKHDPQGWDSYWEATKSGWSFVYDIIAVLYRKLLIRPSLNRFIKRTFTPGSSLLHAGSGGGQVDLDIRKHAQIVPLDISVNALNWYRRVHGECKVIHGSIFEIPCKDGEFDGVYNLGVMEHFTEAEIVSIFNELKRVTKEDGKIVLFWPPEFGLSVRFFKALSVFTSLVLRKKNVKFHPDEITRLRSKEHAILLLERAGLEMEEFYFGAKDLFTQCMIVAKRKDSGTEQKTMANAA